MVNKCKTVTKVTKPSDGKLSLSVLAGKKYDTFLTESIIQDRKRFIRPQSVNCSVRISRPPQFKIRKPDIFGAEK